MTFAPMDVLCSPWGFSRPCFPLFCFILWTVVSEGLPRSPGWCRRLPAAPAGPTGSLCRSLSLPIYSPRAESGSMSVRIPQGSWYSLCVCVGSACEVFVSEQICCVRAKGGAGAAQPSQGAPVQHLCSTHVPAETCRYVAPCPWLSGQCTASGGAVVSDSWIVWKSVLSWKAHLSVPFFASRDGVAASFMAR